MSGDARLPLGRLALLFGLLAAGVYLVTARLVLPWTVRGPSMEPTLRDGDRVLVDLWTYRHRGPRVGEIVLFAAARLGGGMHVKRVVDTPRVRAATPGPEPSMAPAGERASGGLWVEGDNRGQSVDSREYGAVAREAIRGRVFFVYWPPSRAGPMP